MFGRLLVWLLRLLRVEYYAIGRRGDVYLERWVLHGRRYGPGGKLFLHRFLRSDYEQALHDHPWHFRSLILWPGYWEHTPAGRRWYGPLRLLRRPAAWRHRVEIKPGGTCWTLVWTGPKVRSWGFWERCGFLPWREHARRLEAAGDPCGEEVTMAPTLRTRLLDPDGRAAYRQQAEVLLPTDPAAAAAMFQELRDTEADYSVRQNARLNALVEGPPPTRPGEVVGGRG